MSNDAYLEKKKPSMQATKTILFIGHLWPEPTSSAAGYRTIALLKALLKNKDWHLHFTSAADKTEFCANLDEMNIISHTIKLNDSSFDHFIKDLKPNVVFYDRFITEEQFAPRVQEHLPEAINILDTQDLHFLRRARQHKLKEKLKHPLQTQELNLHTDDAVREISAILRCDLSLIISSYEMQLLIEQFKINPDVLHYCPFMLSPSQEKKSLSFEDREHFVMIGNFLHPPNWDAVIWCYQSIWPKIKKQIPQAEVHIYGAYPSDKVWQLNQPEKGFIIKGRAHNAIKTLSQYRVNLAPLRFGAGIKGKVADGFLAGTPCITTKIGQEGMTDKKGSQSDNWGGLVAHEEQEIAQCAIDLYKNKPLWQACVKNGQQIIKNQFNETQHAETFIQRLEQLLKSLSKHRKSNFYGQILRHNLYRSQYFMSKWIEEKNKP